MDAKPVLIEVARALREQGLEAILIGGAAAALQGAPVTTVDLDFLIRKTPANLHKLERLADALGAVVFRPHYPVSGMYRVIRDEDSLQLRFLTQVRRGASFRDLLGRASKFDVCGESMIVASVADIIADEQAMAESKPSGKKTKREQALEALKLESELALQDQIRRLLAKPPSERTHFLRKRIGIASTAL
jgi:hypothetical protein